MITQVTRLRGCLAGAVLLAAVGGFSVARCTADPAADTPNAEKTEEGTEAHTDRLPITAEAIRAADIAVEAVRAGGLGPEILSHATVPATPAGEAIVTARGGGAVTRVLKRRGDSVHDGERSDGHTSELQSLMRTPYAVFCVRRKNSQIGRA